MRTKVLAVSLASVILVVAVIITAMQKPEPQPKLAEAPSQIKAWLKKQGEKAAVISSPRARQKMNERIVADLSSGVWPIP